MGDAVIERTRAGAARARRSRDRSTRQLVSCPSLPPLLTPQASCAAYQHNDIASKGGGLDVLGLHGTPQRLKHVVLQRQPPRL